MRDFTVAINPDDNQLAALRSINRALEAENAKLREERLKDMRKAYEAGYETRKAGASLREGWATFKPIALT